MFSKVNLSYALYDPERYTNFITNKLAKVFGN